MMHGHTNWNRIACQFACCKKKNIYFKNSVHYTPMSSVHYTH